MRNENEIKIMNKSNNLNPIDFQEILNIAKKTFGDSANININCNFYIHPEDLVSENTVFVDFNGNEYDNNSLHDHLDKIKDRMEKGNRVKLDI
ncbi:MAG: hypothetical protein LBM96_07145 [Methanobrevibacter sp.]|jgi:hypothetical protein|nr:hypothetical protein [Candidatus Methanoflexus mossambicus]